MGGVVVLILTLISLGMCFVLPLTPALWVHLPLTAWLSFAVLFNYYAAVTRDPGAFMLPLACFCRRCMCKTL